ncbi:MAG: hypothetical protein AAGA67_07880, partial [Cyanobacteria bacterium P01_F01_bin.153]
PGNLQLLWDPKSFATTMYQILEDLRDRVAGPPALPAAPTFPALTSGQASHNGNGVNGVTANGANNTPSADPTVALF